MTIRIAINGFGRTGRSMLRSALTFHPELEIVAINDLGAPAALARLFARDSVHGRFAEPVNVDEQVMIVASAAFRCSPRPMQKLCHGANWALTSLSNRRASTPSAKRPRITSKRVRRV